MISRLQLTICIAGLLVLIGTTAQAATLNSKGPIMVNYGSGYVAAQNGTQLRTGDAVMAKPGGRGQIVYENGCKDSVEVGEVVLVQSEPPCGEASIWPIYALPAAAAISGTILISNKDRDRPASP